MKSGHPCTLYSSPREQCAAVYPYHTILTTNPAWQQRRILWPQWQIVHQLDQHQCAINQLLGTANQNWNANIQAAILPTWMTTKRTLEKSFFLLYVHLIQSVSSPPHLLTMTMPSLGNQLSTFATTSTNSQRGMLLHHSRTSYTHARGPVTISAFQMLHSKESQACKIHKGWPHRLKTPTDWDWVGLDHTNPHPGLSCKQHVVDAGMQHVKTPMFHFAQHTHHGRWTSYY